MEIKKASRQGIKPLIGVYGKSGGGKTHSALLLARGIVGKSGGITLIDTENKRGHIFSDVIPNGYNVIDFESPFSPERYIQAIEIAEKASDIIVIDSMTHEWDGEGGILEMQEAELERMAGSDWKKREACKMAAWIKPKMAHKKMVYRLLRSSLPIICCLRGVEKTIIEKQGGKTTVKTSEHCSPIFDQRFIFEMLINGEVYQQEGKGGYLRIEKITHQALFACLPKPNEQITEKHGQLIAQWCQSPSKQPQEDNQPVQDITKLKKALWELTKGIHNGKKTVLDQWLKDKSIIEKTEKLETLTADQLEKVIDKALIVKNEMEGAI